MLTAKERRLETSLPHPGSGEAFKPIDAVCFPHSPEATAEHSKLCSFSHAQKHTSSTAGAVCVSEGTCLTLTVFPSPHKNLAGHESTELLHGDLAGLWWYTCILVCTCAGASGSLTAVVSIFCVLRGRTCIYSPGAEKQRTGSQPAQPLWICL